MDISSGIIISDGQSILLGHSTGNDFWDIPKGLVEPTESYIDGAIRETKEEFGLDIPKNNLIELGLFDYNPYKMLYLYQYNVSALPNPTDCYCTSVFKSKGGKELPEIDDYKIVDWRDIKEFVTARMYRVLRGIKYG
jgi:8-oxo-dGTP pyrophosphatase MutT (NUDIX family)